MCTQFFMDKPLFICTFHNIIMVIPGIKGVGYRAIACIGCKTYFFCSLSIEETLKNI